MKQRWATVSVEGLGRKPMHFEYDSLTDEYGMKRFYISPGVVRLIPTNKIRYMDLYLSDNEEVVVERIPFSEFFGDEDE